MFWFGFYPPLWFGAGMDKRAEALRGWESVGLAFAEIGGVTMLEQGGNPKPRMFRNGRDRALVNRMGFNNPGSEKIVQRLHKAGAKQFQFGPILGNPNVRLLMKQKTTMHFTHSPLAVH